MTDKLNEERRKFFKGCKVVVKAPGSFFWTGEHSVMFGQPAIIQQIPLYVYVGAQMNDCDEFQYEVKCIRGEVSPVSKDLEPSHFEKITERWEQGKEIIRILKEWKEANRFKDNFVLKIWSEIPPKVGLNSSGAMSVCLSLLLKFLEVGLGIDEAKQVVASWQKKKVEDLKKDDLFLDVFRMAWMFDDIFHDFSSSGAGPISSLLDTYEDKELILYFSEKKGYGSRHPLQRVGKSYATHLSEIKQVGFWAERIGLPPAIRDMIGVCVVYSGKRKSTTRVLKDLSKWYSVQLNVISDVISRILDIGGLKGYEIAEPLSHFLGKETVGIDKNKLPRETFSRCLGMVSWRMLQSILSGDLESFYSFVSENHALLKSHARRRKGLWSKDLRDLKTEILNSIDKYVEIKLTGAGTGGDLVVFGEKDAIEKVGNRVGSRLHFSSVKSGWTAEPVWIGHEASRVEDIEKEPTPSIAEEKKQYIVIEGGKGPKPCYEDEVQRYRDRAKRGDYDVFVDDLKSIIFVKTESPIIGAGETDVYLTLKRVLERVGGRWSYIELFKYGTATKDQQDIENDIRNYRRSGKPDIYQQVYQRIVYIRKAIGEILGEEKAKEWLDTGKRKKIIIGTNLETCLIKEKN